jgi:ketosteroid isomerase-like protein
MPDVTHLESARRYLKATKDGDASFVLNFFSPDAILEQLPNRIYPQGLRSSASQVPEAFEKGRKILAHQTYEITNQVISGDTVALEVLWTATLAIPFGTLAAGSQMRCHSAMFLEFRDGKSSLNATTIASNRGRDDSGGNYCARPTRRSKSA